MSTSTPGNDVKIEGRFVLFELGPGDQTKVSNPFGTSTWKWQLMVGIHEYDTASMRTSIMLLPRPHGQLIAASVSIRLTCVYQDRPVVVSNISDAEIQVSGAHPFMWMVDHERVFGRTLVELEFRKIKTLGKTESTLYSPMVTSMKCSLTSSEHAQTVVARMLRESILTDITVNAVGGSMRAHRAVLAARSPVFLSMFSHDLMEKELSTVDISDMSIGACRAFIGYLYGDASKEELVAHRSELVAAGDKYGVENLKELCEESMRADVSTENLLERLQLAHLYRLPALKATCVRLLVEFGKMYEIMEDFEAFMKTADQDLAAEINSSRQEAAKAREVVTKQESTDSVCSIQ